MRLSVLCLFLVACFGTQETRLVNGDQRVWITRKDINTDPVLYHCRDVASAAEPPQPVCVKAAYRDDWQPTTGQRCRAEQAEVDQAKKALLERKDQGSEDRLARAERALSECLQH